MSTSLGPIASARDGNAERAVEFALAASLYDVAARAYSILYTVLTSTAMIRLQFLQFSTSSARAHEKAAARRAKIFGLIATYGIEVERGNDTAIAHLHQQLIDSRVTVEGARRKRFCRLKRCFSAGPVEFNKAYELLADEH